jgi:hypothetical protein
MKWSMMSPRGYRQLDGARALGLIDGEMVAKPVDSNRSHAWASPMSGAVAVFLPPEDGTAAAASAAQLAAPGGAGGPNRSSAEAASSGAGTRFRTRAAPSRCGQSPTPVARSVVMSGSTLPRCAWQPSSAARQTSTGPAQPRPPAATCPVATPFHHPARDNPGAGRNGG